MAPGTRLEALAAPAACRHGRPGKRDERPPLGVRLAGCMVAPMLALLLACAALLPAAQAQVPAAVSYYDNSTLKRCANNDECGYRKFCYSPSTNKAMRSCMQCWRCFLFPSIYGSCPDKCYVQEGATCYEPDNCGQGLFCSTDTSATGTTICKSCFACLSDSDALYNNCALSCPSGPLNAAGAFTPSVSSYVFLAFTAAEVGPSAAPVSTGTVGVTDLQSWLAVQGLAANQSSVAMQAFAASDSTGTSSGGSGGSVTVSAFITTLLNQTSTGIICPALPSDGSKPAAVVFPGCPCNATSAAASLQCPAGYRCSVSAYHGLSTEVLRQPVLALMGALCVACEPGQYCPQGTFVKNETDLSGLDCPRGYYCATPATQLPCPAGSFCVARTSNPISCDYESLLNKNPYQVLPAEGQTVLQALRDGGAPFKGNYCPVNSTKPSSTCSGGYYCPNVTSSILCPAGSFCKSQSLSPRPCNILVNCPAGTATPQYSNLAFVILVVVLVSLPLVWLLLRCFDDSRIASGQSDPHAMEIQRSRAIIVDKAMIQKFRTKRKSQAGFAGEDEVEAGKYAAFGRINIRVDLSFEGLSMRLRSKDVTVLESVSGCFENGKMHAIMGPSGCGKTTVLNVLCGKVGGNCVVAGLVKVNASYMHMAKLKVVTGFVPQDDIVHVDLSVKENLAFAAHLKLARRAFPGKRRKLIVEDALDILQLGHVQHTRVGSVEKRGISGGQRKRVSIGLELVGAPSLLFLDEPTSGLDSTASSDVVGCMSDMAKMGMTVVAVIHQPRFSSFDLFDTVLLLGQGGCTVYNGPPRVAVAYFQYALGFVMPELENPADILMDIISGKLPTPKSKNFKPKDLATWWTRASRPHDPSLRPWVGEFMRLNMWFAERINENKALDPATLNDIREAFDEVDSEATGRIDAAQLKELFWRLLNRELTDQEVDAIMNSHQKISNPAALLRGEGGLGATSQQQAQQAAHQPSASFVGALPSPPPTFSPSPSGGRSYPLSPTTPAPSQGQAQGPASPSQLPTTNYQQPLHHPGSGQMRDTGRPGSTGTGVQAPRPTPAAALGPAVSLQAEMDLPMSPLTPQSSLQQPGDPGAFVSRPSPDDRSSRPSPGPDFSVRASPGPEQGARPSTRPSPNTSRKNALQKMSTMIRSSTLLTRTVQKLGSIITGGTESRPETATHSSRPHTADAPMISRDQLLAALVATQGQVADHLKQHPVTRLRDPKIKLFLPAGTEYITQCDEEAQPPAQSPFDAVGGIGHRAYSAYAIFSSLNRWGSITNQGGASGAQAKFANMEGAQSGVTQRRASASGLPSFLPFVRRSAASVAGVSERLMGSSVDSSKLQRSKLGPSGLGAASARGAASGGGVRSHRALGEASEEIGPLHVAAGIIAGSPAIMEALAGASIGLPLLPRPSPKVPGPPPPQEELAAEAFEELVAYHDQVVSCLPGSFESHVDSPTMSHPPERQRVMGTPRFSGMPPPHPPPPGVATGTLSLPVSPFARTGSHEDTASTRRTTQQRGGSPSAIGRTSTIGSVAAWAGHAWRQGAPPGMPVFLTGSPYPGLDDATTPTATATSTARSHGHAGSSSTSSSPHTQHVGGARDRTPGSWDHVHANPLAAPERASAQPSSLIRPFLRGPGAVGEGSERDRQLRAPGVLPGCEQGLGSREGLQEQEDEDEESDQLSVLEQAASAGCLGGMCRIGNAPVGRPLAEAMEGQAAQAAGHIHGAAPQGLEGPEHSYVSRFMERVPASGSRLERNGLPTVAKPRAPAAVRAASAQQEQQQQQQALPHSGSHGRDKPDVARGPPSGNPGMRDTEVAGALLAGVLMQSKTGQNRRRMQEDPEIDAGTPTAGELVRAAHRNHAQSIVDIKASLHQRRRSLLQSSMVNMKAPTFEDLNESLAERRHPSFHQQLWLLLQRGIIKYLRAFWPLRIIDILLLLAASFIIGFIHGTKWGIDNVPGNVIMFMTCLGVLSMVTHLRTFSSEQVLVAREADSGISMGAFFISQNIIDLAWVFTAPAIMLGPYYYLTLPVMPFARFYLASMCVCWWTSGAAYLISAILPPATTLMSGVFVSLILGAFIHGLSPTLATVRGQAMEYIMGISYNRWAMEILTISELFYYQDSRRNWIIMLFKGVGLCGMDTLLYVEGGDTLTPREAISFLHVQQTWTFAYCNQYIATGFWVLFGLGMAFRLLAFLIVRFIKRTSY